MAVFDKERIQKLKLSKRQDGSVQITVVLAQGESLYEEIRSGVDWLLPFYGNSLPNGGENEVSIVSEQDLVTKQSITYLVKSEMDSYVRINKSFSFRSIPNGLLAVYSHILMPKAIIPSINEPDLQIKVRPTDDVYGAEGWTVKEIFDELKLKVEIPAVLNYHVYELNVKAGTPVIAMLQTLFPFPGVNINRFGNSFYVNFSDKPSWNKILYTCKKTGYTKQEVRYFNTIVGEMAEPLYVEGISEDYDYNQYLTMALNLVGGVYGLVHSEMESTSISNYIEEMYSADNKENENSEE